MKKTILIAILALTNVVSLIYVLELRNNVEVERKIRIETMNELEKLKEEQKQSLLTTQRLYEEAKRAVEEARIKYASEK